MHGGCGLHFTFTTKADDLLANLSIYSQYKATLLNKPLAPTPPNETFDFFFPRRVHLQL